MQLSILESGSDETLKAAIHGMALGLAAVMGLYNSAAWLQRRRRHLAINALVYSALVLFECRHVRHHRAAASLAHSAAAAAVLVTAAAATAEEDAEVARRAA